MGEASPWVARFAPLAEPGPVLDLACGGGRHARLFAARGHAVSALDRDPAALALASGPGITTLQCELEGEGAQWPFGPAHFAAVVVTNYLHRPLFAQLLASLRPDGLLIYETFAHGNERFGKPSNPAFLLAPGELLAHAARAGLRVIAFEDGVVGRPKPAMLQRLCACGPDFPLQKALLDPV
ncbi:MAG: class I SAM-dependent methyltransferase [Pseudomonadota bacterium]